jgi:hypothetical protein
MKRKRLGRRKAKHDTDFRDVTDYTDQEGRKAKHDTDSADITDYTDQENESNISAPI